LEMASEIEITEVAVYGLDQFKLPSDVIKAYSSNTNNKVKESFPFTFDAEKGSLIITSIDIPLDEGDHSSQNSGVPLI